jgi:hypothetical protein
MGKLYTMGALAIVLTFPLVAAPAARAQAPTLVAAGRCNSQTIDDATGRLRDYERHSPSSGPAQLVQRFGAIAEVLSILTEERDILNTICSTDAERAPFFAQIAAAIAWALVLESDVAARLNASCPQAAAAFPTMMLADAWLALANVVNDENGVVPASFSDVIPKVRSHAQAAGLTLPPWSDTSAYWRDQIHAKGKAAIATCPSPAPSPSPSPARKDFANNSQISPRWEAEQIM